MVDVTLSCEDGNIQAHKMILAANSSYFKAIFAKLSRQQQQYPIIVVKDMLFSDLKLILEFIYRGQISVPDAQLASLLKSADGLKIKGMTNVNLENLKTPADFEQPAHQRSKRRKRRKRKSPTASIDDSLLSHSKDGEEATDDGSSFSSSDDDHTEIIVTERQRTENNNGRQAQDIEPSRLMEQTLTVAGDVRNQRSFLECS